MSALRWAVGLILVVPVTVVWAFFIGGSVRSFKVVSGSMIPTLGIGDYVFAEREEDMSCLKGRIIAFYDPEAPETPLTKRVVACGGDTVEIRDGQLWVNGQHEKAGRPPILNVSDRSWKVSARQVFVVGDNRNDSMDSIDYGPIDSVRILGVIFFRYWPPARFGSLR